MYANILLTSVAINQFLILAMLEVFLHLIVEFIFFYNKHSPKMVILPLLILPRSTAAFIELPEIELPCIQNYKSMSTV